MAITKSNANAALVFEFLNSLVSLGRGYFGRFDEEAVKNNFVLVYELLDGKYSSRRVQRAADVGIGHGLKLLQRYWILDTPKTRRRTL